MLRHEGADAVRRGRPWNLPLEDTQIADGCCPGTGLVMPHCRRKSEDLPGWKQEHDKSHKQVRARRARLRPHEDVEDHP
jgi:hypothetical protein